MYSLVLAIIHSIPGINLNLSMIENMGKGNILTSIVITAELIVLIYSGYFLISYFLSKRIISEK